MSGRARRLVIAVSACALTLPVLAPLLAAQAQKPSPSAQKTAPVREVDGGWPRDYATSKGLIKI